MRIFAKVAFFSILLPLFAAGGCMTEADGPDRSLAAGDMLPSFRVALSDGTVFDSTDLHNRPGMIVFFNTDCPDCRAELPEVQKAYEECWGQAEFVCISRNEGEASVSAYWSAHSLTLPYSAQEDRVVYNLFADTRIPRIYVYGPQGRIVASYSDAQPVEASVLIGAIRSAAGGNRL